MTVPAPEQRSVQVGDITIANTAPLALIAGPCLLQSADHAVDIAGTLAEACRASGAGYVFKASFDKANRSAHDAARGPGLDAGLGMLSAVRHQIGCPVLTDVHHPDQCAPVAQVADIIQIPAFLCRQTDLLLAAARSGAAVNVKKGQFLAPWDMANVTAKLEQAGTTKILLTERGSSFGYNNLVADMRALPIMAQGGYPVIMDATHAVQIPGGQGNRSGGDRALAPVLARAAAAIGVAGVFLETHEDPDNAPCDGPNMMRLDEVPTLLSILMDLDRIAKSNPIQI